MGKAAVTQPKGKAGLSRNGCEATAGLSQLRSNSEILASRQAGPSKPVGSIDPLRQTLNGFGILAIGRRIQESETCQPIIPISGNGRPGHS
jgi:hypothetical protein